MTCGFTDAPMPLYTTAPGLGTARSASGTPDKLVPAILTNDKPVTESRVCFSMAYTAPRPSTTRKSVLACATAFVVSSQPSVVNNTPRPTAFCVGYNSTPPTRARSLARYTYIVTCSMARASAAVSGDGDGRRVTIGATTGRWSIPMPIIAGYHASTTSAAAAPAASAVSSIKKIRRMKSQRSCHFRLLV